MGYFSKSMRGYFVTTLMVLATISACKDKSSQPEPKDTPTEQSVSVPDTLITNQEGTWNVQFSDADNLTDLELSLDYTPQGAQAQNIIDINRTLEQTSWDTTFTKQFDEPGSAELYFSVTEGFENNITRGVKWTCYILVDTKLRYIVG